MEFLLAIAPVLGYAAFLLTLLFLVWGICKIFKIEQKIPYGKLIALLILLTMVFSGLKIITSPITRPVATEVIDDTHMHKVDASVVLVAPKAKDNSFKPESVDTSVTDNPEIIEHNQTTQK